MERTLLEMYDELRISEKIYLNEIGKDEDYLLKALERTKKTAPKESRKSQDLEAKLKEAEAKARHLNQTIRSLKIQLEEEMEARVDLEIENTKLRKEVTTLKKSMESVNNNCYDADLKDLNLSEVSIMSEDNDITIVGGDHDLTIVDEDNSPSLQELSLSDFKLLSDETLNQNPFSSTASTTILLEKEVPARLLRSVGKRPSFNPATFTKPKKEAPAPATFTKPKKEAPATYTKKVLGFTQMPPVTISVSGPGDSSTRPLRRRSRSVDHNIGEKTIIAPEVIINPINFLFSVLVLSSILNGNSLSYYNRDLDPAQPSVCKIMNTPAGIFTIKCFCPGL